MARHLLPLLLVLLGGALASPVLAGERTAAPEIDATTVGRLLLSDDASERSRGTALLLQRIERGGDLDAFLQAMAEAQAAWTHGEEGLVERLTRQALGGNQEQRAKARRLLAALGPEAARQYLAAKARAAGPPPPSAEMPPPPPRPAAPSIAAKEIPADPETVVAPASSAAPPAARPDPVTFAWALFEVPDAELTTWWKASRFEGDLGEAGLNEATLLRGATSKLVLDSVASLPDARSHRRPPIARGQVGQRLVLVPGEAVPYRRALTRTAEGAWAVETAELRRGLGIRVTIESLETGLEVVIHVTYTEVPEPLPEESVRPAPDVQPLTLDRPEWQATATTLRGPIDAEGPGVTALLPGIVPGRVVVLGLRLVTTQAQRAASVPSSTD